MTNNIAALEQLETVALGGDEGCELISCLISCLSTVDVDQDW